MSYRTLAFLTAGLLTFGGAIALANPSSSSLQSQAGTTQTIAQTPTQKPPRGEQSWLKDLNLSPQQLQDIKSVRDRFKTQLTQQRQDLKQAQQKLRQLMAGDASESDIRAQYQTVKDLRQKLADTQFNSTLAMRSILTPEQRQKFANRMQNQRPHNRPNQQKGLEF
jgi:Spy/CpxP family protein refolding chaperone